MSEVRDGAREPEVHGEAEEDGEGIGDAGGGAAVAAGEQGRADNGFSLQRTQLKRIERITGGMMAETKIEWADYSWNPWYGCHKVSQGCKNCYMFREQRMYGRDPEVVVRSKTQFDWPLRFVKRVRAGQALSGRVFACSWSDWFIKDADPIREEAWEIIRNTPELTYMILTKRPERFAACLPSDWGGGWKNVWLGVSAEDQMNANKRIPILLDTLAVIRFVSAEPLLDEIDLGNYICETYSKGDLTLGRYLDWVIVGGESGPNHRPMQVEWVRSILDQCLATGVAFFFKQWGGLKPGGERLLDGREWSEFPEGAR